MNVMPAESGSARPPVATVESGQIAGYLDGDVTVFKGIPYGAPPVGEHRFRRARRPDPWTGVRSCQEPGPACPQDSDLASLRYRAGEEKSEDCLYLNVWTRSPRGDARPVIVFFHGGGYTSGSGAVPLYDGAGFARRDTVFVTANYRLGMFGFLDLRELFDGYEESGNIGLLDKVAALAWIRDNIAEFGGDPDNVTVFGSSAGGVSIGSLMTMPAARGLFRRAVPVSSTPTSHRESDSAAEAARRYLDYVAVRPGDVDGLLRLSQQQLTIVPPSSSIPDRPFAAVPESRMLEYVTATGARPTGPVVDDVVIPAAPESLVAAGWSAGIDLLLGSTSEEARGSFWKLTAPASDPDLAAIATERQPETFDYMSLLAGSEATDQRVRTVYGDALAAAGRDVTDRDIYAQVRSDMMFAANTRYAAAHSAHHAATFMFRFTWRSPANGGVLGAFHGVPTPFWFDRLHQPGWATVLGDHPPQHLADSMQAALVAFAATGDPTVPGLPAWPRYSAASRATMVLDELCEVADDPAASQRRLIEPVLAPR